MPSAALNVQTGSITIEINCDLIKLTMNSSLKPIAPMSIAHKILEEELDQLPMPGM